MAPRVDSTRTARPPSSLAIDEDDGRRRRRTRPPRRGRGSRRHAPWLAGRGACSPCSRCVGVQALLDARERDAPRVPGRRARRAAARCTTRRARCGAWAPSARRRSSPRTPRAAGRSARATTGRRRPARHRPGHRRRPVVRAVPARRRAARRAAATSSRRSGCAAPRRPPAPDPGPSAPREVSPARAGGAVTPLLVLDPTTGTDAGDRQVLDAGSLWAVTAVAPASSPTRRATTPAHVRWDAPRDRPEHRGRRRGSRRTPLVPEVHAVRLGDRVIRSAGRPDQRRRPGAPDATAGTPGCSVADGRAARRRDRRDRRLGASWRAPARWCGRRGRASRSPRASSSPRDGTRTAVGERPAPARRRRRQRARRRRPAPHGEDAGSRRSSVATPRPARSCGARTGTTGEVLLVDGVVHVAQGRRGPRRSTPGRATSAGSRDVGAPPVYLGADGSLVVVVTADRTPARARPGRRAARQRGRRRPAPGPRPGRRRPGQRVRRTAARPVPRRVGRGTRVTVRGLARVSVRHTRVWTVHTGVA